METEETEHKTEQLTAIDPMNGNENTVKSVSQDEPEGLTVEDLVPHSSFDAFSVDKSEFNRVIVGDQSHLTSLPISIPDQSEEKPVLTPALDGLEKNFTPAFEAVQSGRKSTSASIFDHSEERANDNASVVNLAENTNYQSGIPSLDQSESKLEFQQLQDMDVQKPTAVCKYRWTKSLGTKSEDIGFYPSYEPDNPVLLSWNENVQAYFSSDLRIVCGDYHGHLVVDGKVCPVEEFSIRTYTFEVDLYTKEVPEEGTASHSEVHEPSYEQHTSSLQTHMDPDSLETSRTYIVSSMDKGNPDYQVTSEDDELLKHKMTEDDVLKENVQDEYQGKFVSSSPKSNDDIAVAGMKRHSPVGNADTGKFSEPDFQKSEDTEDFHEPFKSQELRTSTEGPVSSSPRIPDQTGPESILVEDIIRPTRPQSRGSTGSLVGSKAGDGLWGSRPPSVGADSFRSSRQDSLKQSLSNDQHQVKADDRFSPDSLSRGSPRPGSARHKYVNDQTPGRSSMAAISPLFNEDMTTREGTSQVSGAIHSLSRVTPNRDLTGDNFHGSKRLAEAGDGISPSSSVAGRPPSHPGSRPGSFHSSRSQSLLSITSEQELAEYFEQSRSSRTSQQPPGSSAHYDKSPKALSMTKVTERSSSIPNWASQVSPDKRSTTPDIRNQVPLLPGETDEKVRDIHGSSSAASRVSSRMSSRTITPVPLDSGSKADSLEHIKELEASITNLRKLLSGRETEVHSLTSQLEDLRDINRSLKEELDHRGKRHTPVTSLQDSFEYKQLQSEKEILVSEVVALRDEIQRLNKAQPFSSGRIKTGSGISDFSPNSPAVLQRKIVDLEAHIRDLQEVTETTNSSRLEAERKLKLLQDENRELKSKSINAAESQTQSNHDLWVEMRTLQEDIRNLKERNYQLTEENMRLLGGHKSGSKDTLVHSSGGGQRLNGLRSGDDVPRQSSEYTTNTALRHDFTLASYGATAGNRSSSNSLITSKKASHEDLAPKDLRQSSINQPYDLDLQAHESRHLQQWNIGDSSRLRLQPKDNSLRSKSNESVRKGLHYSDRSKPDGEVSAKLYADTYTRPLSHEKQSYEYKTRDRESYIDKHISYAPRMARESAEIWTKDRFDVVDKGDKYRYLNDGMRERDPKAASLDRSFHSSEALLSSRDIYLSLQQKRASQWPQRDQGSQKLSSYSDGYDSDSTLVLIGGYKNEPPVKESPTSQSSSKIGDEKQGTVAIDGLVLNQLFPHENKYISGNLGLHHYQSTRAGVDSTADDSDTATDILLAQDSTPRGPAHRRRTSLGSDESPVSPSDGEDTTESLLRRRSKSVDVKRAQSRHLSSLTRSESSSSRSLASTENLPGSVGFRSVIPAPLVTQHNKGEIINKSMTSLLSSSLTQGLRPFAPRSPADIRVDDVVKFSRPGGKLTQGVVKYVGHLPGRNEAYLGVELDKDEGKHDGTFEGIRYFKCKPNKGVFVAFNKTVMAWAP